ncbi:uncharacterized protein LOC142979344 [Anticarsia gemmatalis]|uniref:uncharacterized protein LOC142979344 n=1 Tax=Anticarsia gemmatalis TaxID=129554 RepID=UPI003F75E37F
MTKFYVIVLIAFTITVKCQAESLDDAERLSKQKDENDNDLDETGRMGAAQAQAYASVTQMKAESMPLRLVNCHACVDCPTSVNTTTKYCPYTNDPTKNGKCVVYAEKYIQMKKLWYVRGCASERGSCADIKRGHDATPTVQLTFCSECEGNQCNTNGVQRITYDIITALFALVLCPILGKYTLT